MEKKEKKKKKKGEFEDRIARRIEIFATSCDMTIGVGAIRMNF